MAKNQYAVFPVEVAKEMLRVYRQLQASGLLGRDTIESIVRRVPRSVETPVFFRNDSGETVPRYACMQVTGTVESGGQNYCTIDKPANTDASSGDYIFNGHEIVPAGGSDAQYGTSQGGRLVRGIKASGTSTAGDKWNPVVGEWTIEQDDNGRFVMAGDDDIATDVARVFIGDGAGGGASIEYEISSTSVAGSSSPYNGLTVASVTVKGAPCSRSSLIGTTVDVVDHSGCIFDLTSGELAGVWGWASERVFPSLASGAPSGTMTPCHWSADNRCCVGGA
jgi:hypothetical protein